MNEEQSTASKMNEVSTIVNVFYLIGCSLSMLALIFQMLLYLLVPCSRRLDQKLLTQMTVARLLNSVFEYLIYNMYLKTQLFRVIVFALYVHTDAALVSWMFAFTKNLYDKVVKVFAQKNSFTVMSVTIWVVTLPVGLMCPLLLSLSEKQILSPLWFQVYYKSYATAKFFVLAVNLFFVCRIFKVAFTKTDRKVGVLKTCVICFVLLSLGGAQALAEVFLNQVIDPFLAGQLNLSVVIAIINSYQAVAVTIIFVILVNSTSEIKLKEVMLKYIIKNPI